MHGTDGDYWYGHDEDLEDDGTFGGLCGEDALYAHYPDDVTAGPVVRGKPPRAINDSRPAWTPGRTNPCWDEQCVRAHERGSKYALRSSCGTFDFDSKPCLLCKMISLPHASRCDNWARGCLGGSADFGPELTGNLTPGSPSFIMGQQVAALNQQSNQMRGEAVAERQAARSAQAGRGGQVKRLGAPGAASAAPRKAGWGAINYAPDDRRPAWAPWGGFKGGVRRSAPDLTNRRGAPESPLRGGLPGQEHARPPGTYIPPQMRIGEAGSAPLAPAAC